jgi:N-methylhydantoinase A/oxoprolinase/acetone carboxylase beta subunit
LAAILSSIFGAALAAAAAAKAAAKAADDPASRPATRSGPKSVTRAGLLVPPAAAASKAIQREVFLPNRPTPHLVLALDTGGTNTDAVLYDTRTGSVLASAKDFTTHHDLAAGIRGALANLAAAEPLAPLSGQVRAVHLSTTLATNAIAEGQGHRVGLVMIGFDPNQDVVRSNLERLPSVDPVFVGGGHDYYGREEAPLDEAALVAGIARAAAGVSAWAVSSFFSIKNPAHELRAAQIISSRHPGPVTMGRALSGGLGAMRRAATAALNAGLVLIIDRLLDAVAETLSGLGLSAPLMVVKGDGGLVGAGWARARPIETVVSGPAASMVGAMELARGFLNPSERDLWVLDVGGTTSDLAHLKDGRPEVDPGGARVGGWHTMVEAVETSTRGLGGDSLVTVSGTGDLVVGPRRVLPLCRLAEAHPEILALMSRRDLGDRREYHEGLQTFFLPNLPPGPLMGEDETEILGMLREISPLPMADYQRRRLEAGRLFAGLKVLTHPAILVSAFTPTDAMNVLGLFRSGDRRASAIAAGRLGARLNLATDALCRAVLDHMGRALAEEILRLALSKDSVAWTGDDFLPDRPLGRLLGPAAVPAALEAAAAAAAPGPAAGSAPGTAARPAPTAVRAELSFRIPDPIILLGAPAPVLAPFLERRSRARVLAPPGGEVASAVGAAASTVSLARKVEVVALPDFSGYRAFLPEGLLDGVRLEALVEEAASVMDGHMRELVRLAGAEAAEARIAMVREDREARLGDGTRLIMGVGLAFTALAGPRPAAG